MKVEVAVLGSQFLTVFMVSVDVAATLEEEEDQGDYSPLPSHRQYR